MKATKILLIAVAIISCVVTQIDQDSQCDQDQSSNGNVIDIGAYFANLHNFNGQRLLQR